MTVNQILVFCLVAELIAFLVIMGILAANAIKLLKSLKVVLGDVDTATKAGQDAIDNCKGKVIDAAGKLADNASIVDKGLGALAGVIAIANYKEIVRKHTFLGSGPIGAFLDKRARKSAEKELRRTKNEVARIRKATQKELKIKKKAKKKAKKLEKKYNK